MCGSSPSGSRTSRDLSRSIPIPCRSVTRSLRATSSSLRKGKSRPPTSATRESRSLLTRWSSLADRGWYSGDIHIHHISPKTCRVEMEAEDLDVANILTSDFTVDQSEFEGRVNRYSSGRRLIYVNQEFRNNHLGHMCLLNLKRLIEPVKTMQAYDYPLHLRACDETRAQGGYVSWAHFPSWPGVESPLDVAMEKLDGIELLSVLDPRAFPVFMKQVVPELEANDGLRLWYRYLNCGFRLTATAGTDKMTTFVTVGANRVFARVEGEFTYQNWIDALKQGRTFVTNSPVLSFAVNGREPGATLHLDSKQDKVALIHALRNRNCPTTGWRSLPTECLSPRLRPAAHGTGPKFTWSIQ